MSNRNKLKEDIGMSTTSCIFGSCCRLAVKQRRDLHIILFSVVASVMIYGMLLASGLSTMETDDIATERTYTRVDATDKVKAADERYDVLINSYMRSGSTITGHLLGHRDDVFYFYEPLRPYYTMSYFKGRDSVCNYLSPSCKSPIFKVNEALAFLKAIYNCSFNKSDAMKRTISRVSPGMVRKSGTSWDVFVGCLKTNKTNVDACISKLIPWCRKAKHRVTKVLRLSLDNTEKLLRYNSRLKVIQLIRDPRGILNSQIHTGWFPFSDKNLKKLRNNAVTMCSRMLHDIEAGKRLMQLFPNRVQIIHYEDFNDTIQLAEYLYNFLGMEFSEKYRKHANTTDTNTKTRETDGYHQFSYRNTLSWATVHIIDSVCQNLYRETGYRGFDSEEDLRNANVSAIQTRLTFSKF